jgi:DNA-binding Xre family transcriptional regulator
MILYTKLERILQERNISKEKLRLDIDIAPNTVAKIKKNEPMNLSVVDKICEYLQVQPGDILEWVSNENAKELEKREIQSQIEALQRQLSEIE